MGGQWVKKNDVFGVTYIASVANNWSATLRVRGKSGVTRTYTYRETAAKSNRTAQSFTTELIGEEGQIVGFGAAVGTVAATNRGQFYMNAFVQAENSDVELTLAHGYVYDGKSLGLGEFVEPGPGGGEGNKTALTLLSDVAGTTNTDATTGSLIAANTIRRFYGFEHFYNASADVASRTINPLLNIRWGALPTGFAGDPRIYAMAGSITLTASQEGIVFMHGEEGDGQVYQYDDGTLLRDTNLPPLPITFTEDDVAFILSNVGSGHANDRHSLFARIEEWLVL